MGYRISLYRTSKEKVDAIRDITDIDVRDTDYDIFNVLQEEEIKYDTLAHVLDTGREEQDNLCSRIFNNKLSCEADMSFYTISKEQLLNIIEYIRKNNIYEFMMDHTVDYDKQEIGKSITGRLSWEKPTWEEAVRHVCNDARWDAECWNQGWQSDEDDSMQYFNIDTTNNKWWISNGLSYKYAIFNFIHILKMFDWEHDYLIAIGS